MNVIAVLLTGSSDQKILSGFNYWLICWWFSWLISLFFDDLSPDRLCKMIVNMLRQASKPFLIHFPSLICSWFWFWFWLWLESVDAVLTVSILQGAPAASALIRGPERRTWEEDWDQDELWTEFRNQEPGTRTRTVYRWFTFLPACVGLRRITGMCWAPGCRPTSTLQQLDCTGCLKTPAHVYGPTVGLNSTGAGSKRLQNVSDSWA